VSAMMEAYLETTQTAQEVAFLESVEIDRADITGLSGKEAQQSPKWGSECVEFRFTDSPNVEETPAHPSPYFYPEAIEAAETSGKVLRLFPYDIDFAAARAEL